jgi:ketosteroid isomerase-like protein
VPRAIRSFLLLVSAGLIGCKQSQPDLAAEKEALLQADREWSTAAATPNVDSVLSFWSDDAIVIPPGQPPVMGKEALRGMVTSMMKIPGFAIAWQSDSVTVSADGSMAYMLGVNQVSMSDDKGQVVTTHGRGVTVWRKDATGRWRCVVDVWNDEPPTPPGV